MTFSIIGRCAETGMMGIAISSSSPAVAARCAHARAGRPDVALGYARKAIELQESLAEAAVKDDDLVSIRDRL